MKLKKRIDMAFCIIFIIILTLPLIFTNFRPNLTSQIENRKLKPIPVLYDTNGQRNPQFISDFEDWFNDNIGFREEMFTINATIQYEVFDASSSEKVLVGKDGWLFYKSSNNIDIAAGEYPNFDENALEDICQKQQQIQQKLAAQGIDYVIFLPPSKVSIYPEFLKGNFEIRETPVDILADYLETHSDIKVIRLKEALLDKKQHMDKLLYFKTDTHWNAYGAYTAYCEIVHQLNKWEIMSSDPAEVDYIEGAAMRDLARMIVNSEEKYYENSAIGCSIHNSAASLINDGEKYNRISNYAAEKGISVVYYSNADQSLPSFLVLGDSMFMFLNILPELLAQNSRELVGVGQYELTQELLDVTKPDVVFFEMTERKLQLMGAQSNEFIYSATSEP